MLWLSSIIIICALVFGGRGRVTDAFIISPKQQIHNVQSAASKNGDNDSEDIPTQTSYGDGISMISDCKPTRRQVLGTALVGATTSLVKPTSAHATAATATKKEMISKTLCDPSVSTWTKKYDSGDMPRTIHILGTAHISSASADLAGQIVRDIKPDVVFVELDAKRVARAIPGSNNVGSSSATITSSKVSDSVASTSNDQRITSTPTPTNDKSNAPVTNPFINSGSKVVGNSVKNMYSKMESDGFKAGDEFAQAVNEGLNNGST